MTMEDFFDPLDLYTPTPTTLTEEDEEIRETNANGFGTAVMKPTVTELSSCTTGKNTSKDFDNVSNVVEIESKMEAMAEVETEEQEEEEEQVIHIFDLPYIALKPPSYVLLFILKLFEPEIQYNFNSSGASSEGDSEEEENDNNDDSDFSFFTNKDISIDELYQSLEWFQINAHTKLVNLKSLKNISQVRFLNSFEFFNYITSIVSCSLSWIDKESTFNTPQEINQTKDKIWKLASLRLAENCGRTAQPEFTRRIVFKSVPQADSRFNVKLKEPSLTADNLGLKTWGSSLILAERLLKNYAKNTKSDIKQNYLRKPILELGAGTGLVGIMAGLLEKHCLLESSQETAKDSTDSTFAFDQQIYLTDLPEITENLQNNVSLNNLDQVCKVLNLDWMESSSFDQKMNFVNGNTNIFNTVILSDPVYSSKHPYLIVNMIKKYLNLKNCGTVILEIPARAKFEGDRELLWKLITEDPVLSQLEKLQHEEEDGYDDFGRQKLIFQQWRFKKL